VEKAAKKNRRFKLSSGLTAVVHTLDDPEVAMVTKASVKMGKKIGWYLGGPNCDLNEYIVLEVKCNGNPLYFVYPPLTREQIKTVVNEIRNNPEDAQSCLLLSFYNNVAYIFHHRTTRLLLRACQTGLPPEICALTDTEKPRDWHCTKRLPKTNLPF
jgi:hypothetical protein